jgi:tetratricopeptide (TPR) repeat protein
MKRGFWAGATLSMLTFGDWTAMAAVPETPALDHVTDARKFGWMAIAPFMDNIEQSDAAKFPGLRAFAKDYRKARQELDLDQPLAKWPPVDIDALVTRNPNFWRASFEIRPGDPGWLYTQAGLLLSAGEATRAQQVLALARQSRGTPKVVRDAIDQMLMVAEHVIRDANETVGAGIELYDHGDKAGAIGRYRDALAIWPQNSFAYYELGLTLRAVAMEAKGEKIPKSGLKIESSDNSLKLPEVEQQFAKSRQHDPLRWEAYQGGAPGIIERLIALRGCVKEWEPIAASHGQIVATEVLVRFSDACQEAGIHELALVARQLVVSRQGNLGRADHTFISTSLRELAPGAITDSTLKFLDNPRIELRELISAEP